MKRKLGKKRKKGHCQKGNQCARKLCLERTDKEKGRRDKKRGKEEGSLVVKLTMRGGAKVCLEGIDREEG